MRVLIIVNPIAGRGSAAARAEQLAERLRERGHQVDVAATAQAGDAEQLAALHGRDADCVVAAGGDGTLREVFAGVGDAAPILPAPLGTANMLARELGIPSEPGALARVIEARRERRIDVGRCRHERSGRPGEPFLAVAGIGFDALVTRLIGEVRRGALGYRGYFGPIARAARVYRAPRLRIWLDGREHRECGFVVVGKVRRYGGVMWLSPDARLDSGRFEVCMVRPATRAHLFAVAPFAFSNTLAHAPGIELTSATHVRVEALRGAEQGARGDPVPIEIDGDYAGTTPVELVIEAGAARVVVGEEQV